MRKFRTNQRGSMLIDAMLGIVITALTVTALVGVSTTTGNIVRSTTIQSDRYTFARNLANDLAENPNDATKITATPQTAPTTITANDQGVNVTRWLVVGTGTSAGTTQVNVSIPKNVDKNCQDAAIRLKSCVTASVTVATSDPGIVTTAVGGTWSIAGIGTAAGSGPVPVSQISATPFTVPTGSGEVRYVVKVSGAAGVGAIEFRNGATVLESILFDETTNTYTYGSVFAPAGTAITVHVVGSTVNLARFYIYKAA